MPSQKGARLAGAAGPVGDRAPEPGARCSRRCMLGRGPCGQRMCRRDERTGRGQRHGTVRHGTATNRAGAGLRHSCTACVQNHVPRRASIPFGGTKNRAHARARPHTPVTAPQIAVVRDAPTPPEGTRGRQRRRRRRHWRRPGQARARPRAPPAARRRGTPPGSSRPRPHPWLQRHLQSSCPRGCRSHDHILHTAAAAAAVARIRF